METQENKNLKNALLFTHLRRQDILAKHGEKLILLKPLHRQVCLRILDSGLFHNRGHHNRLLAAKALVWGVGRWSGGKKIFKKIKKRK